ncbi:hypothetical protein PNEG_00787 [Pneumocystis murina B123]|uniref:Mitochondrial distribution and morphology protein 12 n=1 Tax=Pneumocystis murina (strain B123) TaxID=1069680 RepID=M7PBD0_PNEMU|nr:hypothetical protein PNEG_00787 [Pneumocystis murina B123]EMR11195.1 hypothetical protein PNEG_00787 [Pneumocystis murina B123]
MEFDWSKLDEEFALKMKNFLNQQFEKIFLPSYLRNINVESFDFGSIAPVVDIENIEDPYPHFYQDTDTNHNELGEEIVKHCQDLKEDEKDEQDTDFSIDNSDVASTTSQPPPYAEAGFSQFQMHDLTNLLTHNFPITSYKSLKSNIGTNCLPFFQSTFSGSSGNIVSVSGLSTPHWVGTHLLNSHYQLPCKNEEILPPINQNIQITSSSNLLPVMTQTKNNLIEVKNNKGSQNTNFNEDFQIRFRIAYEGDIRIEITAELHLNYHSTMFITLPVKITLTGLSFEAIAILAYINKRFHFCFIDEEQKEKLLKNIKIESEIGDKSKQILKNVGKIETFLLEQFRKIIERELVFPSWLTIVI